MAMAKKILVIDDSALMRRVLCDIIESDTRFHVEATARDGLEGFKLLVDNHYDAVVLDINMPKMDGLQLLRELQKCKVQANILMASTLTKEGAKETMEALELGALDFIEKPTNAVDARGNQFRNEFLRLIDVVSRVRIRRPVLTRASTVRQPVREPLPSVSHSKPVLKAKTALSGSRVVAIASSTGGPKALHEVIPKFPKNIDAPMLVVQHMPAGFTKSLAERLDTLSQVKVVEASEGEKLVKGTCYIAAGGKHMKIVKKGAEHFIHYSDEPPREGVKPCANYMYESLATCSYDAVACAVLTGMGADGSKGITALARSKKMYVVAQDEASCVVYGMPKATAATGLTNEILPLNKVADAITKNVGVI